MKLATAMKNKIVNLTNSITKLDRWLKNVILFCLDYLILVFSFWFSLSIRQNHFFIFNDLVLPIELEKILLILFLTPIIAIPILYFCGQYSSLMRFIGLRAAISTSVAISVYIAILFLILTMFEIPVMPVNFLLIYWMASIFILFNSRFLLKSFLSFVSQSKTNVLIYGAGTAGVELASALINSQVFNPIAFIDDDTELRGRSIERLGIYGPEKIDHLISKRDIQEILIAIPSLAKNKTNKLINNLRIHPVKIRALPGLTELAEGRVLLSDLREINIEDLLSREPVEPDLKLMEESLKNKTVLVTGAGGSIGSELCRQICRWSPSCLILFEINELSLYLIERELSNIHPNVRLIPILGDVTNSDKLQSIFRAFGVQTLYHTAAYKHVPLVEHNPVAGLKVNVFGTLACIEAAIASSVKNFVFISTDKAVRPTSIMGATKRFSEIILQAKAKQLSKKGTENKTRISMVRFGNVLGSSGSVVPLFREQIQNGGPVTVTDPKIVRYFMTISEASQLVIQAGSMGSEGDIFVLDMGRPIAILQLAKDMIKLSGLTVKNETNPDGEIEIVFTGLRPGEKLYEELLIDDNVISTKHHKIMLTQDKGVEWEQLQEYVNQLNQAVKTEDLNHMREIFMKTVSGFNAKSEIVDFLYLENKKKS